MLVCHYFQPSGHDELLRAEFAGSYLSGHQLSLAVMIDIVGNERKGHGFCIRKAVKGRYEAVDAWF